MVGLRLFPSGLGDVSTGIWSAGSTSHPRLTPRARARRFAAPPARRSAPGVRAGCAAVPRKQPALTHGPLGPHTRTRAAYRKRVTAASCGRSRGTRLWWSSRSAQARPGQSEPWMATIRLQGRTCAVSRTGLRTPRRPGPKEAKAGHGSALLRGRVSGRIRRRRSRLRRGGRGAAPRRRAASASRRRPTAAPAAAPAPAAPSGRR